jgi:hypothetical protein
VLTKKMKYAFYQTRCWRGSKRKRRRKRNRKRKRRRIRKRRKRVRNRGWGWSRWWDRNMRTEMM